MVSVLRGDQYCSVAGSGDGTSEGLFEMVDFMFDLVFELVHDEDSSQEVELLGIGENNENSRDNKSKRKTVEPSAVTSCSPTALRHIQSETIHSLLGDDLYEL